MFGRPRLTTTEALMARHVHPPAPSEITGEWDDLQCVKVSVCVREVGTQISCPKPLLLVSAKLTFVFCSNG